MIKYYKQLSAFKFDGLDEMDQFLERLKHLYVIEQIDITSVEKDVKKMESSYTTDGNVK